MTVQLAVLKPKHDGTIVVRLGSRVRGLKTDNSRRGNRLEVLLFAQAIGDTTFLQIVGSQFDLDPIARQDFDVVSANLSRNVSQNIKPVIEINAEHRVG